MRSINLAKTGALKAKSLPADLHFSDIDTSIKGCVPGEWAQFINQKSKESYFGFVNPMSQASAPCARVLVFGKNAFDPWEYVQDKLRSALAKRLRETDYGKNSRMVFGASDGLPGLIVDSFKNCALAQINTAGLDQFRDKIKSELTTSLGSPVFFLDNEEYRKAEGLPNYESELEINALEVCEGGLHFELSKNRIQKVGFYYDHRENRAKLSGMISRMNKKFQKGLDLFCYAGAWGMTMAKSGVAAVDFVDQADLVSDFDRNLELNDLSGEHRFHRKDGFQFLKEIRNEYDIIVSDPPAFAKSPKGKKKALEGYQKLHRLCLRAIKNNSYFAACSCTRYVDLKEFLSTVEHAAKLSGSKVTLIDIGTQGLDHPCYGLDDKANYLKYGLFLVEKL